MSRKSTVFCILTSLFFPVLCCATFICLFDQPLVAQVQQQQELVDEDGAGDTVQEKSSEEFLALLNKEITDAKTFLELIDSDKFRGMLGFEAVKLSEEELAKVIKELRKRYPFQSVAKKLQNEKQRIDARGKDHGEPILAPATAQRLEAAEKRNFHVFVRSESLRRLHSDKVEEFINRSGFGLTRLPRPGVEQLPIVKLPSRPLSDSNVARSDEHQGPPVELPDKKKGKVTQKSGEVAMVSKEEILGIHLMSRYQFGGGKENGYIKDRENVAGFESHRIGYLTHIPTSTPVEKETKPEEIWQIRRMELVSLLNFDKPGVYISNELPQMEKIKDAKVRPLDRFERTGLQLLRDGEDNHIEATLNRVKMLGSLRATKSCTDCHYVKRGELLGAFSYDIVRVPAISAKSDSP